jgi:hypothetical protein
MRLNKNTKHFPQPPKKALTHLRHFLFPYFPRRPLTADRTPPLGGISRRLSEFVINEVVRILGLYIYRPDFISRRAPKAASPQYEPPILDKRAFLWESYEAGQDKRSLVASGFFSAAANGVQRRAEINESRSRSAKKAVSCA